MNLKELILFGMEESQEPVIKNPILQAALREPRPMAHGGRPGFQSGQLVDHGPGRQGYNGERTKSKKLTAREVKAIEAMIPDGAAIKFHNHPNGLRLRAEISKGHKLKFSESYINPTMETAQDLIQKYEANYKSLYPNALSDTEFEKLRFEKDNIKLSDSQFAKKLSDPKGLNKRTFRNLPFTQRHVSRIQKKLGMSDDMGKTITPLTKTQQDNLRYAFPEYAGKWNFKTKSNPNGPKYGMDFSKVGKNVYQELINTTSNTQRWPTGVTGESRLWHNAYRSALKIGDNRFKIYYPGTKGFMTRDEILKHDWTKANKKAIFLDTLTGEKFSHDGSAQQKIKSFKNWMNEDAVPGKADVNRFTNAADKYELTKRLKNIDAGGDKTLGSLLAEKYKKKSGHLRFSGLVNHHRYDLADNFWDTDIVFFEDNTKLANTIEGEARAVLKNTTLSEADKDKALKKLNKKMPSNIQMKEGKYTLGSYDQGKMLKNVGAQLGLKKGDPLHTEIMKFCPRGKQLVKKAGGGRIGFSGTCSIDEAATGLKNELSKVKNPAQLGKFGKIGRLAGGFFGWVDAPIELTFALPGLLKGDKDEALSNTTLGLFGAGKTEMEKLKPGTALYNVAKNIKDVQDYTNNLFQAKELEAYTTKLEGMLKKYPNDPTIEDDLAQTNLQKQKIIDDTQTIIKDYREVTGDERIQARKELSAQEIASAKEGFTITDVPFVGDVKIAPYGKPKDLSNVKDYIENKGDPYYRAIRVADENLGGIMGYDENAKDIRDRYTDLPLELASQYGTFEKQEADELARQKKEKYLLKHSPMPFSKYVPSILRGAPKFMGFNAGGRVSFKGGGIDKGRRAILKLLAALGIGTATVGTGLIKLGGKAVGKKAAVKAGVDIATSTPGMPSWFPALVNKIIKEGDDVTAKLATQERQIVHSKKIDTGSASPDDVTIYRDLDTGDIRVEVDSVSNMGEAPIQLDYKAPSVIDSGKMKGKKTKSEFSAVESEPRVTNWEGDIEMDGENIVGSVDDLFSDTTKLKNYAKGEKPTMKDIVTRKRKTDKIEKIHNDPSEQLEYVQKKEGMTIDDLVDEDARVIGEIGNPDTKLMNLPDKIKKASGGRVSYFDGGIVSLKKKW